MVSSQGQAMTGYVHPFSTVDLPRPTGPRPAHRPWCSVCKVVVDCDQLDDAGICAPCAATVTTRAAADSEAACERPGP